jgi:hypothetical protein
MTAVIAVIAVIAGIAVPVSRCDPARSRRPPGGHEFIGLDSEAHVIAAAANVATRTFFAPRLVAAAALNQNV